jgi:hypothetical protein
MNEAQVGNLFTDLIHTGQLSDVNPFDYLVELHGQARGLATSRGVFR